MLAGCSVQIGATKAVAEAASVKDVNDAEASVGHPDGKGVWVRILALVDRKSVQRVALWEIYSHVHIVQCASGRETNVGTEPMLEGVDFTNPHAVTAFLTGHPAMQAFRLRSLIYAREGDFKTPQCLQFEGGSYIGQKITQMPIPIRKVGALP